MKARVVWIDPEEGGVIVLQCDGVSLNAMNCLGYGCRDTPRVGDEIEVEFTYMSDDDTDGNTFFSGNPNAERKLQATGLWSYVAFGQLVAVESASQEHAIVDCGVCCLEAPIEVSDVKCIGSHVSFRISRLDAWYKSAD
jgi:hypothetical protein